MAAKSPLAHVTPVGDRWAKEPEVQNLELLVINAILGCSPLVITVPANATLAEKFHLSPCQSL